MERTELIAKSIDGQHYLVKWTHKSGKKEYVVCSYFDHTMKIGSQWSWGHYFSDLEGAKEYWKSQNY